MAWLTWQDRPETLTEILDDPNVHDQIRVRILSQLPRVNRWLGGWRALRAELQHVHQKIGLGRRVLDVGCGVGDLCESMQRWAARIGNPVEVVGIDLSRGLLRAASGRSVLAVRADGFRLPFPDRCFDLVTASMFLHHFTGNDLHRLFGELCRVADRAVVINELYRSRVAWLGWRLWSLFFTDDEIIRYDGAVSVRKGFIASDLLELGQSQEGFHWTVRRHPGFRICLTGTRSDVARPAGRAECAPAVAASSG